MEETGGRKRASSYKIPFIANSKMPTKHSKRKEILEYEVWSRKDKSNSSGGETPKGTRTCLGVTEMPPDLMVLSTSLIYTRVSRHIKLHTFVLYIIC